MWVHDEVIPIEYVKIMRDLREDADKTQQQIAEVLGTSQTMYARYERGANALPLHHLLRLCDYYNVSADYFLGRTRERGGPSPAFKPAGRPRQSRLAKGNSSKTSTK